MMAGGGVRYACIPLMAHGTRLLAPRRPPTFSACVIFDVNTLMAWHTTENGGG